MLPLTVVIICISVQGSYSNSQCVDSSSPASVCVESNLKGLQVELSETCALCLSRLFSVLQPGQARNSQTPAPSTTQESASPVPLVLQLQLNLLDVNMFTLSNVAGRCSSKTSTLCISPKIETSVIAFLLTRILSDSDGVGAVVFRVDEVGAGTSAASSQVLVQGVALSILKSLSESTEPCCPADQTCSPVISLSSLTVAYHKSSHALEVPH